MYDPSIGRWLSEDPIGFDAGDENLYRYVGNDPVSKTDPSGLEEEVATTIQIGGVTVPMPTATGSGKVTYNLRWHLFWEGGFTSEQRYRTYKRGCYDLAGKRLGIVGSDVNPNPDFGSSPNLGSGVKAFSNLPDAMAYAASLVSQNKRVRIFAGQSTDPPAPIQWVPQYPGEVSPISIDKGGHFNYATLHWNPEAKAWYWEWINDANSDQLIHTGFIPIGISTAKFNNLFGVVEITDERASRACNLPVVPWELPPLEFDDPFQDHNGKLIPGIP